MRMNMTPKSDRPPPAAEELVRHLVGQWPRVRVDHVTCRLSSGDATRVTVEACVHLGALLPADVRVALVPGVKSGRPASPTPWPMSSVYSYHNDSYGYEVTVPASELGTTAECVVRVAPAPHLADAAAVHPVVGPVPPLVSSAGATRPPERLASGRSQSITGDTQVIARGPPSRRCQS